MLSSGRRLMQCSRGILRTFPLVFLMLFLSKQYDRPILESGYSSSFFCTKPPMGFCSVSAFSLQISTRAGCHWAAQRMLLVSNENCVGKAMLALNPKGSKS